MMHRGPLRRGFSRQSVTGRGPSPQRRNSVRRLVGVRVAACGDKPDNVYPREACLELLRTRDIGMLEPSEMVRHDFDKVTMLTAGVRPRDAADVLPQVCADFIENPMRLSLRDVRDKSENGAEDGPITPFWDARRRASMQERRKLLLRLHNIGLVSLSSSSISTTTAISVAATPNFSAVRWQSRPD